MAQGATFTVAVTILLALAGYIATHLSNRLLAEREARLARINTQLSELYGPLFADLVAGNAAWDVFKELALQLGPPFWKSGSAPDDRQALLWQLWVRAVFQPRNRRMTERIKTRADLLVEDELPSCLVRLAANTAAYDVLAARWDSPHFAPRSREDYLAPSQYAFPRDELDDYLPSSYRNLKRAQQDLLGKLGRRASAPTGSR
jgi:hypothetical protein